MVDSWCCDLAIYIFTFNPLNQIVNLFLEIQPHTNHKAGYITYDFPIQFSEPIQNISKSHNIAEISFIENMSGDV